MLIAHDARTPRTGALGRFLASISLIKRINLHCNMDREPTAEKDTYSPRGVLLSLAVLLLLVMGGLYLFYALHDESQR